MKTIYISKTAYPALCTHLADLGYTLVDPSVPGAVSAPVAHHADLFCCRLGTTPDAPVIFPAEGPKAAPSETAADGRPSDGPAPGYPAEAAWCAACTGRWFIHRLDITAPALLKEARARGMALINVRQGYARCNTLITDEQSVITCDRGIAAPCLKAGMDVLLIRPGHVLLPGYPEGMIGGCGGLIHGPDGPALVFNGDITAHPDYREIRAFAEARGVSLWWTPGEPLLDIGSIV